MALRHQVEASRNAQPGTILLAVHEFVARSQDEVGLSKGDRIELIEKDDDFGDGWYLGRHLSNGTTGLFPEVYTTCAPKGTLAAQSRSHGAGHIAPQHRATTQSGAGGRASSAPGTPNTHQSQFPLPTPEVVEPKPDIAPTSAGSNGPPSSAAVALRANSASNSTVMNETLNVIDEHMEDMRSKSERSTSPRSRRSMTLNSVSDYAAMIDSGGSYIQGYESEEEEQSPVLSEQEVKQWSPDKMASYFEDAGVDKQHCKIFREQEFSGDVILAMEQSMIFMKELGLGTIGRRLKTWQKIKALQDEVSPPKPSQTRHVSETSQPQSRRASSGSLSMLHRQSIIAEKTGNEQVDGLAGQFQAQAQSGRSDSTSPLGLISGSARNGSPRPSAASVRSLGHSRRHSSMDHALPNHAVASPPVEQTSHSKQPSLDQSWNLSQASGGARPRSSTHGHVTSFDRPYFEKRNSSHLGVNTGVDVDRGCASGNEADGTRHRRLLTKRPGADHTRASSYEQGKRRSTLMVFRKTSAPSSPNHSRSDISAPAYFSHPETSALKKNRIVSEPGAPTVTKLEYNEQSQRPKLAPIDHQSQQASRGKGLRAISDAVTGRERALHNMLPDNLASPTGSNPQSAGSSTPSKESRSFDDAVQSKPTTYTVVPNPTGPRRKSKKKTSAYTRGLERKPPQEQMADCDYSGWMKKKSSNLMTNWKPRLFVLRGRRLSYYYSENDREEKGLIDISGHRVLPADNERITSFHATLTKATSSSNPNSPLTNTNTNGALSTASSTPTTSPVVTKDPHSASTDSTAPSLTHTDSSNTNTTRTTNSSAPPTPTAQKLAQNPGGGFIFKLVPPRPGLSKAVNFTKPTVHYFAVPSVQEGRLWMAALMKATIDRDESVEVVTTYGQKTISLAKARARKEMPPFLGDLDEEKNEQEHQNSTPGAMEEVKGSAEALESVAELAEEKEKDKEMEEASLGQQETTDEHTPRKPSAGGSVGSPREPQMTEVTDLESAVSRRSLGGMSHHRNKSSTGSGFRAGSGLGIQGLNGGPHSGSTSPDKTTPTDNMRQRSASKSKNSPLLESMRLW